MYPTPVSKIEVIVKVGAKNNIGIINKLNPYITIFEILFLVNIRRFTLAKTINRFVPKRSNP
jgi:hypothetical protein